MYMYGPNYSRQQDFNAAMKMTIDWQIKLLKSLRFELVTVDFT